MYAISLYSTYVSTLLKLVANWLAIDPASLYHLPFCKGLLSCLDLRFKCFPHGRRSNLRELEVVQTSLSPVQHIVSLKGGRGY